MRGKTMKGSTELSTSRKEYVTSSSEETKLLGEKIASSLQGGNVILLQGSLGSGKTCFTNGLAKGLHIKKQINSPTYVYVHPYRWKKGMFYHLDLYRVESQEKLLALGVEEFFGDNTIMAVEWPEILLEYRDSLPTFSYILIRFERIDENTRKIIVTTERKK